MKTNIRRVGQSTTSPLMASSRVHSHQLTYIGIWSNTNIPLINSFNLSWLFDYLYLSATIQSASSDLFDDDKAKDRSKHLHFLYLCNVDIFTAIMFQITLITIMFLQSKDWFYWTKAVYLVLMKIRMEECYQFTSINLSMVDFAKEDIAQEIFVSN